MPAQWVCLRAIQAARLRARARAVREADRRVWWMSYNDRARRHRLADLMDDAAAKLEAAAASEIEAARVSTLTD